jgi:hypothetical protein
MLLAGTATLRGSATDSVDRVRLLRTRGAERVGDLVGASTLVRVTDRRAFRTRFTGTSGSGFSRTAASAWAVTQTGVCSLVRE